MYGKNLKPGKRARAKIRAGTGIWFAGLSVCGSMIGIKRSSGCKVGMSYTPDLFWSEMYSASGTKATVAKAGND